MLRFHPAAHKNHCTTASEHIASLLPMRGHNGTAQRQLEGAASFSTTSREQREALTRDAKSYSSFSGLLTGFIEARAAPELRLHSFTDEAKQKKSKMASVAFQGIRDQNMQFYSSGTKDHFKKRSNVNCKPSSGSVCRTNLCFGGS